MELVKLEGTIYKIFPTENKRKTEGKPFYVREFVVHEINGKFDNYHKLQVTNDNVKELDKYQELDEVAVTVAINGRKWQNSSLEEIFFTSLTAIGIAKNLTPELPLQTIDQNDLEPQQDDLPF